MKSKNLIQAGCVILLGVVLAAGARQYENKEAIAGAVSTTADSGTDSASGSGNASASASPSREVVVDTSTYVFMDADLQDVMEPLLTQYQKDHSTEKLKVVEDTPENLLEKLKNGELCDLIITEDSEELQKMEEDGVLEKNTLASLMSDQLTIITGISNEICKVSDLKSLTEAGSISYVKGTSEIRSYLKKAKKKGVALDGCGSDQEVIENTAAGKSKVGIACFSSTYGYEDQIRIVTNVSADEADPIVYVAAQVENSSATTAEKVSAENFLQYIQSGESEEVYEAHYYMLPED